MAHLILLRNPLTPHDREEYALEPGETPIDWLQKHHPTGFGMPIKYYVNADEVPLDDLDRMPDADDIVIIALMPGGFLAAMPLLVKVVIGLAVMAASFFAMQLFAPKVPKQRTAENIESYNIGSDQNSAKIGDPIPVVYGEVWMTPDYVSQPYTWFNWSESNYDERLSGIQYLDVIMCVGQGYVDVTNVKVGDSDANSLGNEVLSWRRFYPNEHNSTMYNISNAMGWNFFENVVTSTEVDNQEFIKQGDASEFFTASQPGVTGRYVQVDIVFPNGLYKLSGDGKTSGTQCSFQVHYCEVDSQGNLAPLAGIQTFVANTALPWGKKNRPEFNNPIRRTYTVDLGKHSRWAVKIYRSYPTFEADFGVSNFVWSGLKLIADIQPNAYGDVTLLACRIKASRGIGSDAAIRVSAKVKRYMNGLPNGEWQHSNSAADAFYDVYTNSKYGAKRSVSELDMAQLRAMKSLWAAYPFNYVFRERTTVWEALKTITVGYAAEPLPLGSTMTIAQDGVKPNRSMLFTDANIVENSFKLNYIFDIDDGTDGVEVQYINPIDWRDEFVRYPTSSVIPESATLPGCTNALHAAQYARLVWQRTRKQRKRVTFDTELEGIILQLGDRIAISHEMPKWGDSGLVLGVNGNTITVDHDLDWSGGNKFIMFRTANGEPSELFSATQGAQPNIVILQKWLTFTSHVDDDYDYTSFTFGDATKMVQDFTVASTRHNGETTVTVEAVNYAPEIFNGAMRYLGGTP